MKFATWNVISWSGRNHEIITELRNFKIDFCAISETKKKGKGTMCIEDYILAYSGKQKDKRAHAGVGLLIHKNTRIILIILNILVSESFKSQ